MTAKVWSGASGGAWSVAGNWTPSGVPAAADTVTINSPALVKVVASDVISITSLTITGGSGASIATLAMASGSSFTTSGAITLTNANSILSGAGALTATGGITGSGVLLATGGTLSEVGTLSGTLALEIGAVSGDTLYLNNGASDSVQSVTFLGSSGELHLSNTEVVTVTAAMNLGANTLLDDGGGAGFYDTAGMTIAGGSIIGTSACSGTTPITGWGFISEPNPSGTAAITASGGTLNITGTVTSRPLVIGAGATDRMILGAASTATSVTFASATGSGTLEIGAAGTLTDSAALAVGTNHVQLDGASSLTDASGISVASGGSIGGSGTINAGGTGITGAGSLQAGMSTTGGALNVIGTIANTVAVSINSAAATTLNIETTNTLAPISITSANQTLEVSNNANVTLSGAQTVTGGQVLLGGGTSTLTDASGVTLGAGGSIAGAGTVAGAVTGSSTGTINASTGTLTVTGAVTGVNNLTVGAAATDILVLNGTSNTATGVTFASATGAGALDLGAGASLTVTNAISTGTNKIAMKGGTLTDTAGVTIGAGGSLTGFGFVGASTALSGTGTVTASGGTLDLQGAVSSGVVLAIATTAGSDLKIDGTATSAAAIAINNANQTLEIGAAGNLTISVAESITNGTIKMDGGTLTDTFGVTLGAGSKLTGSGTVATGTALSGTGTVTASGGTLDLKGTVSSGVVLAIANVAGSDLKIDGTATSAAAIGISNATQTLEVGAAGALTINVAESITNGAIKMDGGSLKDTAGLTLGAGSSLTGSGTVTTGVTAATELQGAGTVTASGGTLTFADAVDQTGAATTFDIANGADLVFKGAVGTGAIAPAISFAAGTTGTGTLDISAIARANGGASNFHGVISNYVAGDTIALTGAAGDKLVVSGSNLLVENSAGVIEYTLNIGATDAADSSLVFSGGKDTIVTTYCFMAGTRIRTPDGEVAVETLRHGDLVLTSDGRAAPVAWLGVQTISTVFADPSRVNPIRVKAGALAENVPTRDLLVSPDHAVLVEGALIQAGALVNGTSVVRETRVPKVFVYYHVELDDHSLILAEGAPAETFVDNVDRLAFDNWAEHQALYPQGKSVEELPYPRAKSHRQVPVDIRVKLAERAQAIGAAGAAVA